ncbi:O-antigen ligase family protein [Terrihabitans sp. B22-R8]|uniref:O-antigen ligase family protein n=1 Tax=Terrihabitans sp. B22-R8 TaxID=3425128 RepID=UPI00403CA698
MTTFGNSSPHPHATERSLNLNALALRDGLFFTAVVLMNFTLLRPSPVDLAFIAAISMSVFVNQRFTGAFLLLLALLAVSITSFFASSLHLLGDPEVRFQIIIKTYVVLLAAIACYVSMTWGPEKFRRYFQAYVVSCVISAGLGIFGFLTQNSVLTWDGRGKGLLDDPNMYSSFLVPGALACMYFLSQKRSFWATLALGIIIVGILVSFSRAGIAALLLCGSLYLVFLNRRDLGRAFVMLLIGLMITLMLGAIAALVFDQFSDKIADRFTFAKSYDVGHGGRYDRYGMAFPIILDHPLGIGLLQFRKYFDEPVHNIFIGAFMYYGWASGLSWLVMVVTAARLGWRNWRMTRHPMSVLLSMCFLAVIACASLHEGEHWRHLWFHLGLMFGFNPTFFPPPKTGRRSDEA